jgi:hypothetical protein
MAKRTAAELRADRVAFAVRVLKKANEKPGSQQEKLAYRAAAFTLLQNLPPDVRTEARDLADKPRADGATITRRGRRADLLADPKHQDDLIIKVSIAGSGYGNWRTEKEKDDFVPEAGTASNWGWTKIESDVTCYRREKDKGPELLFAGPGGKGTTGVPTFGGALDRGSNKIDALKAEVPKQVRSIIKANDVIDDTRHITLLIRAHSRGAVAGDIAANELKAEYKDRITVELVVIEPVPGPSQSGEKKKIDIGGLDQSTLVMSLNPDKGKKLNLGFTSQQVFGAKRIILTTQNHSAGLSEGFVFKGRRYTGSAMNSLPEGIYIDTNKTAESGIDLDQVSTLAGFKAQVDKLSKVMSDDETREEARDRITTQMRQSEQTVHAEGNVDRINIIETVLANYLTGET